GAHRSSAPPDVSGADPRIRLSEWAAASAPAAPPRMSGQVLRSQPTARWRQRASESASYPFPSLPATVCYGIVASAAILAVLPLAVRGASESSGFGGCRPPPASSRVRPCHTPCAAAWVSAWVDCA